MLSACVRAKVYVEEALQDFLDAVTAVVAAAERTRRIIDFLWCFGGEQMGWARYQSAVNEHIQINTQAPPKYKYAQGRN